MVWGVVVSLWLLVKRVRRHWFVGLSADRQMFSTQLNVRRYVPKSLPYWRPHTVFRMSFAQVVR